MDAARYRVLQLRLGRLVALLGLAGDGGALGEDAELHHRSSSTGTGWPSLMAGSKEALRIASTAFSSSPKPMAGHGDLSRLAVGADHHVIEAMPATPLVGELIGLRLEGRQQPAFLSTAFCRSTAESLGR